MMRWSFVALLLTASWWGSPAAVAADIRSLGARCAVDSDCGDPALVCVRADAELGTPGPSGGICTAPCDADNPCSNLSPTAGCLGLAFGLYCFEACSPEGPGGSDFDPEKCHGRDDVACTPAQNPATGSVAICVPRCSGDAQCGPGLFCNPGTGSCDSAPPSGAPPGTACDAFAEVDPCAGFCNHTCVEPCVIGAPGACAFSSANSRHGAACLYANDISNTGNLAGCVRFCNCSSDCTDAEVCEPRDFQARYPFAGACARGRRLPGAPDCLDRDGDAGADQPCALGRVHACKTGGCLGVAECLPNGEYGECRCLPGSDAGAPDAGRADRSASDARSPSRDAGEEQADAGSRVSRVAGARASENGCACRATQRRGARVGWAWLGVLIPVFLVRRRKRASR